jgi:hypothetical protein
LTVFELTHDRLDRAALCFGGKEEREHEEANCRHDKKEERVLLKNLLQVLFVYVKQKDNSISKDLQRQEAQSDNERSRPVGGDGDAIRFATCTLAEQFADIKPRNRAGSGGKADDEQQHGNNTAEGAPTSATCLENT